MEQKNYPKLKGLFDKILQSDEIKSSAQGYYLHDGMFFRKWVPHDEALVGDPVVQFVVPSKFRQLVLRTTHDNVICHLGVKKTYDRILRHC